VAILFVLGRIAHVFGMDRPAPNALRIGGMLATYLPLLTLAGFALALPYLDRDRAETGVTFAASSRP
jgi:uncharacterized membrane protein YecN with MAPEG domain